MCGGWLEGLGILLITIVGLSLLFGITHMINTTYSNRSSISGILKQCVQNWEIEHVRNQIDSLYQIVNELKLKGENNENK